MNATPKLTIGMAHFADYSGVYFSTQALRLFQDVADCEILIVDNDPTSEHGKAVKSLCEKVNTVRTPVRYLPFTDNTGTTQTRERIFSEARGEAVLVMDCHVLLQPNDACRLIRA